jgi:hypothetical protein
MDPKTDGVMPPETDNVPHGTPPQGVPRPHKIYEGGLDPKRDPQVLEGKEALDELSDMGKVNAEWILRATRTPKIKWGSNVPKKMTWGNKNYASIYRGNTFVRFAPFVMKTDIESDQSWAQFYWNDFYDLPASWLPWERASLKVLWMPLDKSEYWAENLGGAKLHIRVDEHGRCQLPLFMKLNETERYKILKNNRQVGMALLLKARLTQYQKNKPNWMFYIIIVLIIGIVGMVAIFWWGNPHFFSNLFNSIGGFAKSLAPPGGFSPPSATKT